MKASELRLDNWIADKDTGKVFQVYTETFADIENGHLSAAPIPLTEEWLIKFGFEVDAKDTLRSQRIKIETSYLNWYDDGSYSIGKFPFTIPLSGPIKYVHQLQNLYFALTGEELTIKETV